ncbi:MAG TPA: hypothetical protein VFY90_12770 [Tepidiformaceae bacterium]|nr:hypothetical protein [Tepidiformaceae bacterium]
MLTLAYLSQGKLFLKSGDDPARQIESKFGEEARQRAVEVHQRHAWKAQGRGNQFLTGAMLWGANTFDPRRVLIQVPAVTRGAGATELMYVLQTDTFGGLFTFDWNRDHERRIMHRAELRARDISRHPTLPLIAYALYGENGTARIVVANDEHGDAHEVTEGDSVDEAPSWVPGQGRTLVYQAAGVARNPAGYVVGFGPSGIYRLNVESGHHETLAEDPRHDLMLPRIDVDGRLWFVRRPYRPPRTMTPLRLLQDIVLFPFRLARAVFHWLNFISLIYSRKPLTSAGGPKFEDEDVGSMVVRGRRIDAEKALRKAAKKEDAPSVVPRNWELVVRDTDGSEEVVARGVIAYDLTQDGGVVWTNGTAIFRRGNNEPHQLIERGRLIDGLAVLTA